MKYVAESVECSLRNEHLSWDHHRQVASLPSAKAKELLDKAEAEELTTRELRQEVKWVKFVSDKVEISSRNENL